MDDSFAAEIQARIDNKIKPVGSLGLLEKVALQLALIQSRINLSQLIPSLSANQACWYLLEITALQRRA